MKKRTKVIIGVLVVLVLVALAGSPSDEDSKVGRQTTESGIDKEVREGYMEGCLGSGESTYGYCECTYDNIVDNYGVMKILQIGIEAESREGFSGLTTEIMLDAVTDCLDK